VPWRVSLLSLFSTGLAASALALMVLRAFPATSVSLAVVLGAVGGLALEMWNQATLPKGCVYTVTVALLAGLLLCLSRLRESPSRHLVLGGLALGLAFGGHFLIVVPFLPFVAISAFADLGGARSRARSMVVAGLFLALGSSLYLYLPLRTGSAHPAFRWAEPVNLKRFEWLVLRRQYFSIEKQERGPGGRLLAGRFAGRLADGMTPLAPALMVLGAWAAWRRREWWVVAVLAGSVAEAAAAALYPKLEADALWVADPFFTSGWYGLAVVSAYGLAWAAGEGRKGVRMAALAGVFLLAGNEVRAGFARVSKRWNYYASDQQANLAANLPRNSLLFCEGDAYIAPLLYGLNVDGQRPDVWMIIPIFLNFRWGLDQLSAQYPDLRLRKPAPWANAWLMARDMMEDDPGRPWNYTLTTSPGWPFAPYALPEGLFYRIRGSPKDLADPRIDLAMMRFRLRDTLSAERMARDPFGRVIRENYVQAYFARAIWRHTRKEDGPALALFTRGRRLGSPECALNEGLIRYAHGDVGGAEKAWREAAARAPNRPEPWADLGLAALVGRPPRPDEAIRLCEKAMAADPSFMKSYEVMANAWYQKGDLPQAIATVRLGLARKPADPVMLAMLKVLSRKGTRAR
jgi:tetratricopeptide (TPR) repeat protein